MGILQDMMRQRVAEEQAGQQPATQSVVGRMTGFDQSQAPIYRSTYDVTLGAAQYGAADTAGLFTRGLPSAISKLDPLVQFSMSMEKFKNDHPEYSAPEVHSAAELIQSPAAMSSRVFSSAAQMAAGLGATAIPGVGLPLAAGLTFTVEGERAYEEAISRGADQQSAERAFHTIGATNAAFEILTNVRVLNFAKGEQGWFARRVADKAEKIMRAGGLAADAIGTATTTAIYGSLQGAANEGLANLTYGRRIDSGFLDRRLQDAIGGAASAAAFGLPMKGIHMLFEKPGGGKTPVELDVYDRDSFRDHLVNEKKMEPEHAQNLSEIVDAFARNWASRMNEPVEKWYGTYVQPENVRGKRVSDHVAADAAAVPSVFIGESDPVKSIQKFFQVTQNDVTPTDRETFKNHGIDTPEKMTDLMTRYLQDGIAPSPELVEPFESYKQLMKDVYRTTKAANWRKIPSEVRAGLDRVFSTDTDLIAEARQRLYTSEEQLLRTKKLPEGSVKPSEDIPVVNPETGITIKHIPGDIEQGKDVVKAMYDDIRRLQLGRLMPDRDSAVARRATQSGTVREVLRHETPDDRVVRSRWQEAIDWLHTTVNEAAPLKRFKSGQLGLDAISDVKAHQRLIEGGFRDSNWDAYHNLSHRDRNWFTETTDTSLGGKDGYYYDNFHRFMDAVGTPNPIADATTEVVKQYREQSHNINTTLGGIFSREGGLITERGKEPVPYQQPKELRMLRFATDELREAVNNPDSPVRAVLKKALQNQDPKADLGKIDTDLKNFVKPGIREGGPLTDARTIQMMPTGVIVNGRKVQLLHTEPREYLNRAVRTQAYQIGWNRVIGDSDLVNAHTKEMKKFVEVAGLEAPYNINTLKQRFADKGIEIPEHIDDLKQLEKLAKLLKIETGPRRKDYIATIDRLTIDDISPSRAKSLKSLATNIGGVDPELSPVRLLDEVKRRVKEGPLDAIETLTERIRQEGGSGELFNKVIRQSQGIPVYLTAQGKNFERTTFGRALGVVSGLVGTAQTSLSVVANIPQTLVQVGHMAGLRNLAAAADYTLKNYNEAKSIQSALGAIGDTHLSLGLERGYYLEGLTRNFRQLVQVGTGMKFIGDMNNIIAGEAFRRQALEWKKNPKGFSEGDASMLRKLEMTPEQIKQIREGKMDDLTFAKVVQQGVAKTQYVTESAHNKGWLENHPLTRVLFAYNSYASGSMRSMIAFAGNWKEALASKNPEQIGKMFVRTAALVGGSLGAGALAESMRNVVRGDVAREQKDEDDTLHKGLAALWSVQLMGPAQRMLDAARYDGGSKDAWIVGLMPQVRAIGELYGLARNAIDKARGEIPSYGKFAKFDALDQISDAAKQHTPLMKAIMRWKENIAYPNTTQYNEAKAAAGKFIGQHRDAAGVGKDEPLNPEYYKIWQWAVRGDENQAVKAAQEYYDNYYARAMNDPEEAARRGMGQNQARLGLHQSLRGRSPLNMNVRLMSEFIDSLPADKQNKYIETHARYMRIVNTVAPSNR